MRRRELTQYFYKFLYFFINNKKVIATEALVFNIPSGWFSFASYCTYIYGGYIFTFPTHNVLREVDKRDRKVEKKLNNDC